MNRGALDLPSNAVDDEPTTIAVQRYLDGLTGDAPVAPAIRALLERAHRRLEMLCGLLLHQSYPRLTRAPLALETGDMVGLVTERLLKALETARPQSVRQFFALASQHMRWQLNDLARRCDAQPKVASIDDLDVPYDPSSGSPLTPLAQRMLDAIEKLPEDEREAFDLVRVQGFSQSAAAHLLGVSSMTVGRRLSRSIAILSETLEDLQPESTSAHVEESLKPSSHE